VPLSVLRSSLHDTRKTAYKPSKSWANNQNTYSNAALIRTNTPHAALRKKEMHLYDVYQQDTQTRIKINQGSFEL
jgi:hypothetical protein